MAITKQAEAPQIAKALILLRGKEIAILAVLLLLEYGRIAACAPQKERDLTQRLRASMRNLKASQSFLWSCIYASDLP